MMDESSRAVVLRDKQLLNNQPDTVVGNKEQKTGVTEDSERNKECEEKEYRSQRAPTQKQEERQSERERESVVNYSLF